MTKMMSDMMGEEKKPVQVDCPPPPDQKSITISAPAGFNISTEGGPSMDNKLSGMKAVLSAKKKNPEASAPKQEQQGGKKSKKHRRFKLRKRTRKRNRMLNKK